MNAHTKDAALSFLEKAAARKKRQPKLLKNILKDARVQLARVAGFNGLPLHAPAVEATFAACEEKQKALLRKKTRKKKA